MLGNGLSKFGGLFFDIDGALGTAINTADSTGVEGNGHDDKAQAEAGDEKGKQALKVSFTPEQQSAVDLIVKERLERAQKKALADAEKLRKQAEEESLTKNQEFKTLADQRQGTITDLETKLKELEPLKEQAGRYRDAMLKIVQAQVSKLPPALKVLVEKMDPLEQMDYLAEHAKELNLAVDAVPETKINDSTQRLNKEALDKAKQNNAKLVKGFFGG